eukprot:gb/GECH01001515.1/.p1 GENE.gb/GECH01001515.1/~~gb/GECH01001515.1/.p1  ORF type:complete len:184 (+),score=33.79 gb/GECH01001515.1/:1-552(+)
MPNILVAATGSVASIKLSSLVANLKSYGKVKVVLTESSQHFLNEDDILHMKENDGSVYTDQDEWASWKGRGDPVLHIELRKWADIMLIAPLSANTLAKMAAGICDNLLTCVCRAWDYNKPLIVAPAMNTMMWEHPFTEMHLKTIKELGIIVISPVSKTLICGDSGIGAMASVDHIVKEVQSIL